MSFSHCPTFGSVSDIWAGEPTGHSAKFKKAACLECDKTSQPLFLKAPDHFCFGRSRSAPSELSFFLDLKLTVTSIIQAFFFSLRYLSGNNLTTLASGAFSQLLKLNSNVCKYGGILTLELYRRALVSLRC